MDEPRQPTNRAEAPEEPGAEQPSEEELRAQIEEELRTVRVQDLLLESVVSVLNLTARRIAKEDERDLEQARVGIEAVRAVVDLLEPEPRRAGPERPLAGPDALRAAAGGGEGAARSRAGAGGARRPRRRPRREPTSAGRTPGSGCRPERRSARSSDRLPPAFAGRRGPAVSIPDPYRRTADLTDFLTDYGVVIALVCAAAAVVYGALVTQRLLAARPATSGCRRSPAPSRRARRPT